MSKFKVGDRVRITPMSDITLTENNRDPDTHVYFNGEMREIASKTGVYTIKSAEEGHRYTSYHLKEVRWEWVDAWLRPAEFSKADLKPGYVVEMRDGRKALILPYRDTRKDKDALILAYDSPNSCSWDPVDDVVADDLSWTGLGTRKHDIIRVWGLSIVGGCAISVSTTESRPLIWERKETKKMTVAEVCKALGYDVEIVKEG